MSLSRRKSFDLLTVLAESDDNPSPTLFNLVDLISLSLRSKNRSTVAAVLKLLSVILRRHHQYALTSLFKSEPSKSNSKRTLAALDNSIMHFFSLASCIDESQPVGESYEGYLKDASNLLENHPCSIPLLRFKAFSLMEMDIPPSDTEPFFNTTLTIHSDDKVFLEILALMESFFTNDVITNLSLTETFIGLACCGLVYLDRWLLPEIRLDTGKDGHAELNDFNEDPASPQSNPQIGHINSAEQLASAEGMSTPLLTILQKHTEQIQRWRHEVTGFDNLLWLRKRQLQEPTVDDFPSRSVSAKSPEPGRHNDSPTMASFGDALAAQRTIRIQSRSSSPRGRKFRAFDSSTPASEVNSTAPSRSPIPQAARMRSPWASPLREASRVYDSVAATSIDAPDGGEERRVSEALHGNIAFRLPPSARIALGSDMGDAETSSVGSAPTDSGRIDDDNVVDVSINHILTNTLILREFLLEIAAVVQVRAGLLGEVGIE